MLDFGEFAFHPLKCEMDKIQSDPRGNFVIEEYENEYYKVSKIEDETKSIEYIFTKKKRVLNEFTEMCNYHQTSPNSHFYTKEFDKQTNKKRANYNYKKHFENNRRGCTN